MKAETLHEIVPSASLARCRELIDGYNWCARLVGATTVPRAAMLIAMVAEESASLRATEEYATGAEYNGRRDLGNIRPGDGPRFKGRTLIQITGRNNYGATSRWAHARGLVPTATYFVDHPAELAQMKYAWVGPAEYWQRNHGHGYGQINAAADAHDIVAATYMVNGGQNGLQTRIDYWKAALRQGTAILPDRPAPPDVLEEIMAFYASRADFEKAMARIVDGRVDQLAAEVKAANTRTQRRLDGLGNWAKIFNEHFATLIGRK